MELIKDKHGYTAKSYVTDAVRAITRAIEIMPELASEFQEILVKLEVLKAKFPVGRVASPEQIAAREAKKQAELEARNAKAADRAEARADKAQKDAEAKLAKAEADKTAKEDAIMDQIAEEQPVPETDLFGY